MTLGQFLFSFRGRVNRAKYWLFWLCSMIALWVVILFVYPLQGSMAYAAIVGAASVIVLYAAVAVAVKRLHDRDKSAWWMLVFYGVPAAATVISIILELDPAIPGLVSLVIGVWALVELGCLPGTAGPNKYGPDPLQEGEGWLRYH
jgi:uncharacterized membrane protein YhaH (DUF805 family)